jgi:hypothetical protein
MFMCASWALAAAPSDPKAKKLYDHDYEWLSHFPANFITTNIRGENDTQYPERRQAALDLLREKHDLTSVPEMMDELKRASFLSGDICDILGDWHAKKALPLLSEVAADNKRHKEVREKAKKAIYAIKKPVVESPEPSRPAY